MEFKQSKYLFLSLFTLGTCFAIRWLILYLNLPGVNNFAQETFRFGWVGLSIYIILIVFLIYLYKPYKRYPFLFSIIFAGVVSNILEKFIFGYVFDYIFLGIGVANFADILIYASGLYILFKELFASKLIKNN
jgi:lipoprotein signal peptidase